MACDMPKPCEFPSLDSCQKRFLWDYKEAELASYQVVGLAFQVRYAKEFPQALGFESLDSFLKGASRVHVSNSKPQRKTEVTRDLYN